MRKARCPFVSLTRSLLVHVHDHYQQYCILAILYVLSNHLCHSENFSVVSFLTMLSRDVVTQCFVVHVTMPRT